MSLPSGTSVAWRRLHPISPALRSWKIFIALVVLYGQERLRSLFPGAGAERGVPGLSATPDLREVLLASSLLVVVVVVASALGVASWWMTRYAVDDAAVRLHSGVLFRQQRSAQLDRVQAVDVVRPLLARILGFAEVRVEVAGGAGSGIRLAYLRRAEAERLQAALLARTQQLSTEGDPTPAGDTGADGVAGQAGTARAGGVAAPVLSVPFERLVGSVALGTAPLVLAGVAGAVVVAVALSGSAAPLFALGPALLGTAAGIASSLTQGGAWTVESTPVGLRLRHGLLERRSQTIPRGRVQAVRVSQPPLWRLRGWWRMQVNVAGYAAESGEGQSSTQVVPVCTRAQVEQLLALVLPGGAGDAAAAGGAALAASDLDDGLRGSAPDAWTSSPRRAGLLDPFGWRRQGLLATPSALLLRRGRWWRALDVVPHGRTQSLGLSQGPWQRRLRLATLTVHSTPGPVQPVAAHLDATDAGAALLAQAERAQAARARPA